MKIDILKPTDQPTGNKRLLDALKKAMQSEEYSNFWFATAYANISPFLRLKTAFDTWKNSGKKVFGYFGVDQGVTTKEVLKFSLDHLTSTHIINAKSTKRNIIFHPKVYFLFGEEKFIAFIGSNNFTLSGMELNFESSICLEGDIKNNAELIEQIKSIFTDLDPVSLPLDKELLDSLIKDNLIVSEPRKPPVNVGGPERNSSKSTIEFPSLKLAQPSAIPKESMKYLSKTQKVKSEKLQSPASSLLIQIIPHHNGEILLSKNAVDQDQSFFGWPFTGHTTPKKKKNKPYPQRVPDPNVDITVINKEGNIAVTHQNFKLNMVYYTTKSEIRITVPQDVISSTPDYSLMKMSLSDEQATDYDIEIYTQGSPEFKELISLCNQTMPSGGKPIARRFGWV